MAGTPDRTTIKAAVDELTTRLRQSLVAAPPVGASPFRSVEVGPLGVESVVRPFMTIEPASIGPVSHIDQDKVMEVAVSLRAVVDVSSTDPHITVLDAIGAVDDFFDAAGGALVIEGAAGFEKRAWSIDYPRESAGSRVAVATAAMTFTVKVERSFNRNPAE